MVTSCAMLGNTIVPYDHETAPGQGWRAQTCTTNRLEAGERGGHSNRRYKVHLAAPGRALYIR